MNREIIKKYKKEFDAWLQGKEVEWRFDTDTTWSDCDDECGWHNFEYRIKPKPVECWVNIKYDGSERYYGTPGEARLHGNIYCFREAVHLVEK